MLSMLLMLLVLMFLNSIYLMLLRSLNIGLYVLLLHFDFLHNYLLKLDLLLLLVIHCLSRIRLNLLLCCFLMCLLHIPIISSRFLILCFWLLLLLLMHLLLLHLVQSCLLFDLLLVFRHLIVTIRILVSLC